MERLFVHHQSFHESDIRYTTHFTFTHISLFTKCSQPQKLIFREFLSSHYSKLHSALNTALRPQWTKFLSKDAEMHEKSILNCSLKLQDVIPNNKLVLNTSYYLCQLLLISITFILDMYKKNATGYEWVRGGFRSTVYRIARKYFCSLTLVILLFKSNSRLPII